MMMTMMMMMTFRRRRSGGRRDIKVVSVEAVNAQAAFYHRYKTSSPTHNNDLEPPPAPSDPLPVRPSPHPPAFGAFKLVPRNNGGETPGLAHCPICYDVLVPETGSSQQRGYVANEHDVTRRRPVMAARGDGVGRYIVTNHLNNINSMYSV